MSIVRSEYEPSRGVSKNRLWYALLVLFGINLMNFYDRQVVGAVGELVRNAWELSDTQLGSLTTAFILLYAAIGLPLGRWADVGRRKLILAAGVLVWSVMTALSGLAPNFEMLFICRLGVGVGEASCAPAANSLLGDLFPPEKRGRAIGVFMLGLPLGLALSYVVSGEIAQALSWQAALFVAGAPGLILGVLALWLPEPARGAAETTRPASKDPADGSAIFAVLRIPTMWWIIFSGALQNLVMYALFSFLTSFLLRYHGLTIKEASWINGLAVGAGGGLGMLGGGWLCDRAARHRASGRLIVGAVAMVLAAPCFWLALEAPRGAGFTFAVLLLPAYVFVYVYYASVYASIQDIVPPRMRGMAMAVYFFVFYLFAAAGLYAFGWLSDYLAEHARATFDLSAATARSYGLHQALYVVPMLLAALSVVLFVAARTIGADVQRLRDASRT